MTKTDEQYGPPAYRDWIHSLPCVVASHSPNPTPCRGPIQECHIKSRGTGGDWKGNTFPACMQHHTEQGSMGIKSFPAKYGLDLAAIAAELATRGPQE